MVQKENLIVLTFGNESKCHHFGLECNSIHLDYGTAPQFNWHWILKLKYILIGIEF
jgi:hypothetical protein